MKGFKKMPSKGVKKKGMMNGGSCGTKKGYKRGGMAKKKSC